MRILYDYQALFLQKYGGVSRYFYEIINGIRKQNPEDELKVKAAVSVNYYFRNEIHMKKKRLKHGNDFLNNNLIYATLMMDNLIRGGFDIVHPTFYYDGYLRRKEKLLSRSKVVVTIHDMIHERFGIDESTIEAKKESLINADGIIAVSEYTKNDMLGFYPFLADKPINVIYHGNSLGSPVINYQLALPSDYVLFVGQRDGYKNFKILLEAFRRLSDKFKDIYLVVSGGGQFSKGESKTIYESGMESRVVKCDFTDTELAEAYHRAIALVFPSKYEGFGIPIIEAFSQDCPVILSGTSCFPEVAGDAGLYFDPDNSEELSEKIRLLYCDTEQRENLKKRGRDRLKLFSWDSASRKTREFYKEIARK